jgi:2-amino-4-hydroxy-6-hydroxymethyldihydropteridine diphosphokinase
MRKAVELIDHHLKMFVIKQSSFYETVPVGYEKQDKFINMCLEIQTSLSPIQLLKELQKIEFELKRKRLVRWGPRTIDIDILLYEDVSIEQVILTIPHPRMTQRQFVLIPLRELNDRLMINNESLTSLIMNLEDQGVRKLKNG